MQKSATELNVRSDKCDLKSPALITVNAFSLLTVNVILFPKFAFPSV